MGHLLICIAAASAMGMTAYTETSSLLFAFMAYSLTGTFVLFSILFSDLLSLRAEGQFKTTE